MSNECVTNPVPASQVVNVDPLEWGILTPPDCTNLIGTVQSIIDAIKEIREHEFILHCIAPESNSILDVIQALINKECEIGECGECPDSTEVVTENPTENLEYCVGDGFNCESSECLDDSETQTLIKRVVGLSILVKAQCTLIENLETRITVLENKEPCCDSNLQEQINDLQTQLNNL